MATQLLLPHPCVAPTCFCPRTPRHSMGQLCLTPAGAAWLGLGNGAGGESNVTKYDCTEQPDHGGWLDHLPPKGHCRRGHFALVGLVAGQQGDPSRGAVQGVLAAPSVPGPEGPCPAVASQLTGTQGWRLTTAGSAIGHYVQGVAKGKQMSHGSSCTARHRGGHRGSGRLLTQPSLTD